MRGRGWQILSGHIIYFQHELSRKIYFQVNQGQNIYFHPQQNFAKQKKGEGEEGGSMSFKKGCGYDFPCDFFFTFLQNTTMCFVHIVHM